MLLLYKNSLSGQAKQITELKLLQKLYMAAKSYQSQIVIEFPECPVLYNFKKGQIPSKDGHLS